MPEIPGYDFGKSSAARSPVTIEELRQLEASAGWTNEDADTLARHRDLFLNRATDMVDAWRSVIGSQPHLAKWSVKSDGQPDAEYSAKTKARFVQWVRDVCERSHDQRWLDYQEEIGLRHTPAKKNVTDQGHTAGLVPLRYLLTFSAVIALTARRFFAEAGVTGEEARRLEDAWTKAVILHVTLWSRPYIKEGLW